MPKSDKTPRHRSGAVAKMLHMPVATLRVWERRYQVSRAALSPSGQRLYSAEDIQRLSLLKQLTDLGHAISSLAGLDIQQLLEVAATHASAQRGSRIHSQAPEPQLTTAWRVAVIGRSLTSRLQRPTLLKHLQRPMVVLGPFDDATQAGQALRDVPLDVLLVHEPTLQADWLDALSRAAPELQATPKAVLYGFASDTTCDALAKAGVGLLREPQNDPVLAQWLQNMLSASRSPPNGATNQSHTALVEPPAPRRWTDTALIEFAGRSFAIACECPRHLAELLVQLSHFEDYSAQCANRNPTDAQVHNYLWHVTAGARAQFEQTLIYVAQQEGLSLPPPSPPPEHG